MYRIVCGIFAGVGDDDQTELFARRDNADIALIVDKRLGVIRMDFDALKAVITQINELFFDIVVVRMDAAEGDQAIGIVLVERQRKLSDTVKLTFAGGDGQNHAFVDARVFHAVQKPL